MGCLPYKLGHRTASNCCSVTLKGRRIISSVCARVSNSGFFRALHTVNRGDRQSMAIGRTTHRFPGTGRGRCSNSSISNGVVKFDPLVRGSNWNETVNAACGGRRPTPGRALLSIVQKVRSSAICRMPPFCHSRVLPSQCFHLSGAEAQRAFAFGSKDGEGTLAKA